MSIAGACCTVGEHIQCRTTFLSFSIPFVAVIFLQVEQKINIQMNILRVVWIYYGCKTFSTMCA